tara:strand:- start:52 stop:528 length:477 start_codon:yes stop_codon:yes gene_type:complete
MTEEIYLAGGCLWGVQEFFRHISGILSTEAGRANGKSETLEEPYDDYAECVKINFNSKKISVSQLVLNLFEIIDPYAENKQGPDVGRCYRTGVYSKNTSHLREAEIFIRSRMDYKKIKIEILYLHNYIKSNDIHQFRLARNPNEFCHIPKHILHKYKT